MEESYKKPTASQREPSLSSFSKKVQSKIGSQLPSRMNSRNNSRRISPRSVAMEQKKKRFDFSQFSIGSGHKPKSSNAKPGPVSNPSSFADIGFNADTVLSFLEDKKLKETLKRKLSKKRELIGRIPSLVETIEATTNQSPEALRNLAVNALEELTMTISKWVDSTTIH